MPDEPGEATAPEPAPGEATTPAAPQPVRRPNPLQEATHAELRQHAEDVKAGRVKRKPPADSNEIERAVLEAQEELKRAGGEPPFSRDPYRLVLAGLSVTLGVFPKVVRRIENALSGATSQLSALVETVRHPFTDEERGALRREMKEAVRAASKESAVEIASAARATDRRSLALAFGGGMLALALTGVAAFFAGKWSARDAARAEIAAARAELDIGQQRVSMAPAHAQMWQRLWLANPDIVEAVRRAQNVTADQTGRRAGAVPLWLDPPAQPGRQAAR